MNTVFDDVAANNDLLIGSEMFHNLQNVIFIILRFKLLIYKNCIGENAHRKFAPPTRSRDNFKITRTSQSTLINN
jgi:hypothetical protein